MALTLYISNDSYSMKPYHSKFRSLQSIDPAKVQGSVIHLLFQKVLVLLQWRFRKVTSSYVYVFTSEKEKLQGEIIENCVMFVVMSHERQCRNWFDLNDEHSKSR